MKRFFISAVIIFIMAACNNSGSQNATANDTGVGIGPDKGAAATTTGTGSMGADTLGVDTGKGKTGVLKK
ncbi:MAG: hypothetical protein M3342_04905 [Bacteroidota bacterium]|nr:hypothetical protein [Flavisolibacter sp.]MDQ3843336.1 hypothetical protein [Bacteroidota bacterium]